ncbi:hypothetical protein D3C72_1542190 [compost metagenome]
MTLAAAQPEGVARHWREGHLGRARHLPRHADLHFTRQDQAVHVGRRFVDGPDAYVGMAARVALQQPWQPFVGQRRHDGQRHRPLATHAELPRRVQHPVMGGKQFSKQRRHRSPQRRQLGTLAGFEQRRAQLLLQVLHGGRHRGLRTERALRGQAEAAVVRGQQELAQVLDLQGRGHGGLTKFGFPEINLR